MSPLFSWGYFVFTIFSATLITDSSAKRQISLDNPSTLTESTNILAGVKLVFNCNADAVNLGPQFSTITRLRIKRQSYGSEVVTDIADLNPYNQFAIVGGYTEQTFVAGRDWVYDMTAPEYSSGTRSMNLKLTMNDATCSDAAIYECIVNYYDNSEVSLSGQQNLTSRAVIRNQVLSITPQRSEYKENENVKMTCAVDGPRNVQLIWRYGLASSGFVQDYPKSEEISMETPTEISNDDCNSMRHLSTLSLQLRDTDNDYMYVCVVLYGEEMEIWESLTITISNAAQRQISLDNPSTLTESTNILAGVKLVFNCNADAVHLDPQFSTVTRLRIKRQSYGSEVVTDIADLNPYNQFAIVGGYTEQTFVAGRDWEYDMTAPEYSPDTRSMNLKLTMNDATRSDAAIYECIVNYYDNSELSLSGQQNLTSMDSSERLSRLEDRVSKVEDRLYSALASKVLCLDTDGAKTLAELVERLENATICPGNTDGSQEKAKPVCERGMSDTTSEDFVIMHNPIIDRQIRCDATTDGGGWIVFQRREFGDVDFYRNWTEYKQGFGNLEGDFWLGNEAVHKLTDLHDYELRVDVRFNGEDFYAQYSTVKIEGESDKYRLELGDYSGTVGDANGIGFIYNNLGQFSTVDEDNDSNSDRDCADFHHGAWWHKSCTYTNLNGIWGKKDRSGVRWYNPQYKFRYADFTEMKIRQI